MRRIVGTITATLAIVAIAGVLLSPPKNIPLGDGVDQADNQESNTGEQSEFFVHRINPPVSIPLGDGVDQATSADGRGKTVELTDFIVDA